MNREWTFKDILNIFKTGLPIILIITLLFTGAGWLLSGGKPQSVFNYSDEEFNRAVNDLRGKYASIDNLQSRLDENKRWLTAENRQWSNNPIRDWPDEQYRVGIHFTVQLSRDYGDTVAKLNRIIRDYLSYFAVSDPAVSTIYRKSVIYMLNYNLVYFPNTPDINTLLFPQKDNGDTFSVFVTHRDRDTVNAMADMIKTYIYTSPVMIESPAYAHTVTARADAVATGDFLDISADRDHHENKVELYEKNIDELSAELEKRVYVIIASRAEDVKFSRAEACAIGAATGLILSLLGVYILCINNFKLRLPQHFADCPVPLMALLKASDRKLPKYIHDLLNADEKRQLQEPEATVEQIAERLNMLRSGRDFYLDILGEHEAEALNELASRLPVVTGADKPAGPDYETLASASGVVVLINDAVKRSALIRRIKLYRSLSIPVEGIILMYR